ncbi:MAG TPA: phospholipid carrier-dependent glycosyltransferase [Nocardioidaceae bacterium]|jgi:hypothetical protein
MTMDRDVATPSTTAPRDTPDQGVGRLGHEMWVAHRPFLIALGLGAVMRLVVSIAFPSAFIQGDGPTYLGLVDHFAVDPDRPVGYGVPLRVLSWISRDVTLVAITQHLLGLATAVLVYALLRRWGVSGPIATLATLPVLFDSMQLVLEHTILSDVVFDFAIVLGISLLAWHRTPRARDAFVAGLVLGAAVLVRVVGEPVLIAGIVFCLMACHAWRPRLVTSAALCIAFLLPIAAYATWYHESRGVWALTEFGGKALYMRTTTFVDCSRFSMPEYEAALCPIDPLGERQDPTEYGWHDPTTIPALEPPPGVSDDEAMHAFATRAIRAQPLDYLRVATRDFAMNFYPERKDLAEYDTADKWLFETWVDYEPTDWTGPAYDAHGGPMHESLQPIAGLVAAYGQKVFLRGPLLLGCLLLALCGIAVRRRSVVPDVRPLAVLTVAVGTGLMLVPDLTAEFIWRYQLPAVILLPMAAALGWTRLRTPQPDPPSARDEPLVSTSSARGQGR